MFRLDNMPQPDNKQPKNPHTNRWTLSRTQIILFSILALLASTSQVWALESDRNQPITIDANTAERDELAGTITYSGKVQMAQGSMRIDADQIIIYNNKDKVTKIIARGKPAQYQQRPSEDAGKVIAKAHTIEYRIDQESLRLIKEASLQQEGTSLSGTRIEYDVRKSVVKASGNQNQQERVRMVIPPKALNTKRDGNETAKNTRINDTFTTPVPSTSPNNKIETTQ